MNIASGIKDCVSCIFTSVSGSDKGNFLCMQSMIMASSLWRGSDGHFATVLYKR